MGQLTRRSAISHLASLAGVSMLPTVSYASFPDHLRRGLIMGTGEEGRCDDFRLGGPTVRWVEAEKSWFMWYYARDRQFPEGIAPALGTGRIALAKSKDGIRWERFDGPSEHGAVMSWSDDPDAFDSTHVGIGDITRHRDKWLMWYFGGDRSTPSNGPDVYHFQGYRMRPGLAISDNGVNWERVRGSGSGGALVDIGDNIYGAFPNSFYDGKRHIMQYTTVDKDAALWRTIVCVSEDLKDWEVLGDIEWESDPNYYNSAGIATRQVIRNPIRRGRKWLMIYAGLDGREEAAGRRSVNVADSDDGIRWRRLFHHPIFTFGQRGSWDDVGIAYPQLVTYKDELRMYYYGFSHPDNPRRTRGIGLAISKTGDIRDLKRVLV